MHERCDIGFFKVFICSITLTPLGKLIFLNNNLNFSVQNRSFIHYVLHNPDSAEVKILFVRTFKRQDRRVYDGQNGSSLLAHLWYGCFSLPLWLNRYHSHLHGFPLDCSVPLEIPDRVHEVINHHLQPSLDNPYETPGLKRPLLWKTPDERIPSINSTANLRRVSKYFYECFVVERYFDVA